MPMVDVLFGLSGNVIPADHGYHLYSAVSQVLPEIHGDKTAGIHPISGRPQKDRLITLVPESVLGVRIDSDRVRDVLPLAGKKISLDGHDVRVGVPRSLALIPSARLYSRLVVIKGFMEPDEFLEAAGRQLKEMVVQGRPALVAQPLVAQANQEKASGSRSPFLRRTIRIHDKQVVGFALRVEELTAEESIMVQEKGLGGRRRFGCGIFIPDRR